MSDPHPSPPRAWIVLGGHPTVPAEVRVSRYPLWARIYRTALLGILWWGATIAIFFITIFDPFITSIPFFVGGVATWQSWRGRFRIAEFRGACPRCHNELPVEPGTRVSGRHALVCFHCHHEPELVLSR